MFPKNSHTKKHCTFDKLTRQQHIALILIELYVCTPFFFQMLTGTQRNLHQGRLQSLTWYCTCGGCSSFPLWGTSPPFVISKSSGDWNFNWPTTEGSLVVDFTTKTWLCCLGSDDLSSNLQVYPVTSIGLLVCFLYPFTPGFLVDKNQVFLDSPGGGTRHWWRSNWLIFPLQATNISPTN